MFEIKFEFHILKLISTLIEITQLIMIKFPKIIIKIYLYITYNQGLFNLKTILDFAPSIILQTKGKTFSNFYYLKAS